MPEFCKVMKFFITLGTIFIGFFIFLVNTAFEKTQTSYEQLYHQRLVELDNALTDIIATAQQDTFKEVQAVLSKKINAARLCLKAADFWLRYLEPVAYKKLNGPLPVEWETEVFEKYEKPYRREGAGLTLAALYLEEDTFDLKQFLGYIYPAKEALKVFSADSITQKLKDPAHFFYAHRLQILNLSSIYNTGFECPDTSAIVPEIKHILARNIELYDAFIASFEGIPSSAIDSLASCKQAMLYLQNEVLHTKIQFYNFPYVSWIKGLNQVYTNNANILLQNRYKSVNLLDYSINNQALNLYDKDLYFGQNTFGIYASLRNARDLEEVRNLGKLLFYDPMLSANGQRSCASCHPSETFFTDTAVTTALNFDHIKRLNRNAPSLLNVTLNHLLMQDGKHFNMQNQAKDVITNPDEMGATEKMVLDRINAIPYYRKSFSKLAKKMPQKGKPTFLHIVSALTAYAGSFNTGEAKWVQYLKEDNTKIPKDIELGFGLFMGKAQCGTCHFFPFFNGAKPPFIGSEFEVIGTPMDTGVTQLSADKGRFLVNPAIETLHAIRTPTLLNVSRTKPYMHNGVFGTLAEVLEFYNQGGGAGKGLVVNNQTLSSTPLNLSASEKKQILAFLNSLNEDGLNIDALPLALPKSKKTELKNRKIGGEY